MKNLDMFKQKIKDCSQNLLAALKDDDEQKVSDALDGLVSDVVASVKADYEAVQNSNDAKILSDRNIRQLTSAEQKYWNAFIKANKQANVKQAIANIDVAFPETVIEDIYKEMTDNHPLLKVINFQNVATITKWIMDDSSVDKAVWGELSEEITKEIEGAIKLVEMTQGKLSAFAVVPLDILDLGPAFVDAYIRRLLSNALYSGLEYGIVSGKGVDGEPIGLDRDIHAGVSVSTTEGYPVKEAKKIKDLSPVTYGELLAQMCKTEKGNYRTLSSVAFAVNPVDYYKKIMPATTIQGIDGTYKNNIAPFPTEFVQTTALPEGKAIIFVPEQYFFGIGTTKDGKLEFDDSFKFLQDKRTYKIKMHANGRGYDNTVAIVLDITELEALALRVKTDAVPTDAEVAPEETPEVAPEETPEAAPEAAQG